MRTKGFDSVASYYDRLAKLVYGETIVNAQIFFLHTITPRAKILILGGGSGEILPVLFKINPDCEIYFIEASQKMIMLAKRHENLGVVHFIYGTEQNIPKLTFDCVLTGFYLDLFTDATLRKVVSHIGKSLGPNAKWIATDFIAGKLWQRVVVKLMYTFFKIVTTIETRALPDWQRALEQQGLTRLNSAAFFGDFIHTVVYQKVG